MIDLRKLLLYVNPYSLAAQRRDYYAKLDDEDDPEVREMNAARVRMFADLAKVPTATWIGDWSPWQGADDRFTNVPAEIRKHVARAPDRVFVWVAYAIMGRDGNNYSAGGVKTLPEYLSYAQAIGDGIRSTAAPERHIVVIEPDAIPLAGNLDAARRAERNTALRAMVAAVLDAGGLPLLDCGCSDWLPASTAAQRLLDAGLREGCGFSLNVSHYEELPAEQAYAVAVKAELAKRGVGYPVEHVIDAVRRFARKEHPLLHPHSYWCNVVGAGFGGVGTGQDPFTRVTLKPSPTAFPGCKGIFWIKNPCASDGPFRGAPPAGAADDEGTVDRFLNAKPRFWTEF